MNELIKELEKQCWDNQTNHLDSKKFAELIIKECAKIAEDIQKFYDDYNDGVVNTEISTMIEEHFGIE